LKIIIQATPQSCEPVSWGILHLAHWLTIPTHVTRELLDRIQFCLMPLTNPDGVALGMSVTNSLGQVPKFEYHLAEKGEGEAAMETQAIWNYFVEKKPDIVSEIHAHYRWDTMWRTIGWDDSEAIPENLREKNEHLITAVKAAYPDSHPETDYSVIDYRKPSHDVYGTREMNGIDILGFWLQAIPETIESHNADVREFIQTIAWALMNE
ncbi:MAG: hypothetical protein HRT89_20825, partial [Lentisphaeria bacterium]|nr:hypothetical protein [Lentisphaeria bacterium]